ncbi:MAG: hypothetical protein JNJ83_22095 [Verrucomicrobiaceae bacterium]|nr:hypothetical protein [Verrucomicrobiaceae bacterium]
MKAATRLFGILASLFLVLFLAINQQSTQIIEVTGSNVLLSPFHKSGPPSEVENPQQPKLQFVTTDTAMDDAHRTRHLLEKIKMRSLNETAIASALQSEVDKHVGPAIYRSVAKLGLRAEMANVIISQYQLNQLNYWKKYHALQTIPNPEFIPSISAKNSQIEVERSNLLKASEAELKLHLISACRNPVFAEQIYAEIKSARIDHLAALRKERTTSKSIDVGYLRDVVARWRELHGTGNEKPFIEKFGMTSDEMLFLADLQK